MKTWGGRILLALVVGVVSVGAGAQEVGPTVSGRVVRADNGAPIEGASVWLERGAIASSDGRYPTAITDKNGGYRFGTEITAGTYNVIAFANGYVTETYSSGGTLEGKFQHLDASHPLRGIDFRLEREAVIRGELVDAEGKPGGAEIAVAAVRKEKREDGSERLLPVSWVKTDSNGKFALEKLEGGTYFVCVNGPNGFNAFENAGGWVHETWYGNSDSVKGATPLAVKAGDERNGVRIALKREKRYQIIVWPSGPDDQPRPERYNVSIEGRSHTSSGYKDGSWVIPGIPPGHYRLVGIAWGDRGYMGGGDANIDVVDADVTVHLQVGGLGEIHGRVQSDGSGPVPEGLMVGIKSEEAAQGKDVDAAGHFVIDRVLPGRYRFDLLKKPEGVVEIRSVRCGGVVVSAEQPLQVRGGEKVEGCEVVVGGGR